MPRPKIKTITIADADLDGICVDINATGAGTLTPTGALVSGGVATTDLPRHVSITSTADESGVTFTFTGTDRIGNVITEDVTGPNATTVEGSKNFATITSIAVDGALTSTQVDVGTADALETGWYPLDLASDSAIGFGIIPNSTNANFTMQHTFDDVWASGFDESDANAFDHDTVVSKTAAIDGNYAFPAQALRLKINSLAGASTIKLRIVQSSDGC